MNDIGSWATGLSEMNLGTEADVRAKVVVPLLEYLGYPETNMAHEFPVFGHDSRRLLTKRFADVVAFDSADHHLHNTLAERGWVEDHALLVVELKRPGRSLEDALGQIQFYARWMKVPFYALTDGVKLVVFRMQGHFDDVRELECPVADISRHWAQLRALLGYVPVLRYCAENRIKSRDLPAAGHSDYLRALLSKLARETEASMERAVSSVRADDGDVSAEGSLLEEAFGAFPVGVSGEMGGGSLESASYTSLLGIGSSAVVLSEPGGGKTRLTQLLAKDLALATQRDPEAPVPVVLKARSWSREFGSIAQGVRKEIESFAPGTAVTSVVEEDLAAGRFVVLVDGLDEAPRAEVGLLRAELIRVANRTATRLIATCRKEDYRRELRGFFDECSIDPLTDEQITAYVSRELAGVPGAPDGGLFLYHVGRRLSELVRTPLFLVMTVAVMKRGAGRLPKNRGELYQQYATFLLTEWARRRLTGRPFEVEASVKTDVLCDYARMTWRMPPNDRAFAKAVMSSRGLWDGERVRDELLRSGLVRLEAGGPEFFHPSFREYFLALGLSKTSDEELARFVEENNSDDALAEVFAFLVGLLEDENRQTLVLDRLEAGNLYVFGRCLRTRTRYGGAPKTSWSDVPPADSEGAYLPAPRYLEQLRATHVALVDAHFGAIKDLLPPWSFVVDTVAADREVAIRAHLDAADGVLGYELKAIAASPCIGGQGAEDRSETVTLGPDEEWQPGKRKYRNLRHGGAGLDSARETALEDLTEYVEKLLKKKRLPLGDNHPLGVEYVEEQLRNLRNRARRGLVPKEFEDLSLRRSLQDVRRVMDRYGEEDGGPVKFAWPRDPLIGGLTARLAGYPSMREYLERLEESGLDPASFLPPERDVSQEELARASAGKGSVLVDKFYSDEAVALYIGRYYDLCQAAYRWIAEHHFPVLKDQMGLYRVGPVRHRALVFRNMREDVGAEDEEKPSWVYVDWDPVPSEAEARTICEVTHEWPRAESVRGFDPDHYPRVERALRELGRVSTTEFANMWSRRSHALTHPMGGMAVHDEVYQQLQREIVTQLMRGMGGRLP
jgi:hypothetical protein